MRDPSVYGWLSASGVQNPEGPGKVRKGRGGPGSADKSREGSGRAGKVRGEPEGPGRGGGAG